MPIPIIVLLLILTAIIIIAVAVETYNGRLDDNGTVLCSTVIHGFATAWLILAVCQPLKYRQEIEATVQTNTFQGQTHYYINYSDTDDVKRSAPIGYVKPNAKVFVREPVRTYFGIYFLDLPTKIEVIDVKVQSSEHETKKACQCGCVSEVLETE